MCIVRSTEFFFRPEMACGLALKRPHEYDSYLADESFPHEAKRARQTAAHCSPFRPQMGTIAANLPSTSSFAQAVNKDDSPFAAVAGKCQLSESQLDAYLRSEVRSGQRRKLLPKRSCIDLKVEDENTPRKEYRTPNSPPQSGSDSEGESTSIRKSGVNSYQALVRMICERLLREQEMRLRYEYELALNQKLDGMEVVGLVSGGKDSCYNMMCAVNAGHRIVALANLHPGDRGELDSYMYQSVGSEGVHMIADAMRLPLYRAEIRGKPENQDYDYSLTVGDEVEDLYELLKLVKEHHPSLQGNPAVVLPTISLRLHPVSYEISGVSVGAILSSYQKLRVEDVCRRLNLTPLCYLWERDQKDLLREMISNGLDAIVVKVAAIGLNRSHVGRKLSEAINFHTTTLPFQIESTLNLLHTKYGVHPCGEGGEYETFVLDCPLFCKAIVIDESEIVTHQKDPITPVLYLRLLKLRLVEK
ncbi:hypothetical protein NECAME_03449 [Necator americanus]|uniref:Diphthine--ammonia ligase n=1 Tax=Necator americanus TaxID=51031 RepID=W2T6B0_NECAM|nr:hypothetical protein NECAME_03449 [Necator americanus]ETN76517.1 hypothetical protein NECAME_03449 [Necator americanus]